MKMCDTVSTIWGSPIAGATELEDAVEFTKRWLSIGAADIEHADHDGSASAPQVYRCFSMILDEIPDTRVHIERTVGHRLRSEAAINGRTLKEGHPKFAPPGA
ncbi:MAG TPA: hypothetical protein VFX82_00750 [Desulfobacterales bacterium]|nr:hypothetical protein [Desulfobacterales bacterium]